MNSTTIILIILGLAAAVILGYFLTRKKEPEEELPPVKQPPKDLSKKPAEKKPELASAKEAKPAKPAEPAPKEKKPKEPEAAPPPKAKEPESDEDEDIAEPVPAKPAAPPRGKPVERAAASRRPRDVAGLRKGLAKSRESGGFVGRLRALFGGKKEIDPELIEQMEEVLLTSDVGVKTTELLLEDIKSSLGKDEVSDSGRVWQALRDRVTQILSVGPVGNDLGGLDIRTKPTVIMVVGVNGVGKTTTIGKLAAKFKADGRSVLLAAGDTFRAAAVQQLEVWGKRVGCDVVKGKDGSNPGSVLFDAIRAAEKNNVDIVLADTAGRLHTKTNLMDELSKVSKSMGKALEGAPHEVLLVLDATNGQNAVQQAAMFKEALPITGIVLTKLDGTAKGGVILGIASEQALPVRFVGIGERTEDLREFAAEEFVEALLGQSADSSEEAA